MIHIELVAQPTANPLLIIVFLLKILLDIGNPRNNLGLPHSSAKSDYQSMASTSCEIIWLSSVVRGIFIPYNKHAQLFCDNQVALYTAIDPVFHERTKHIEIDCYIIQEKIQQSIIQTFHVLFEHQIVDIMTKPLGCTQFIFLTRKMGIINIRAPPCEGVLVVILCFAGCTMFLRFN